MPAVETNELRKRYGKIEALAGVSLNVKEGEIYGLLGQNGAGKTTLVKILLGITGGWEGHATLLGARAGTASVRSRVGYLPEDHHFPDFHTGYSLLNFYGELLGLPRAKRKQRILEMLEMVGIADRMSYKIRTYSKGMKQRLGIAQALMHKPEVIFLDEPTDGVDPVGRRDIRELLQELKKRGTTIFINSHLLGEVELVCDRVAIMRKGKMIREGDVATLTRQKGRFLIGLAPGQAFPIAEVRKLGYAVEPLGDRWEVHLIEGQSIDPVVDYLRAQSLHLRHLVEKRQTLEDLFLATHEDPTKKGDKRRDRREEPEHVTPLKVADEEPQAAHEIFRHPEGFAAGSAGQQSPLRHAGHVHGGDSIRRLANLQAVAGGKDDGAVLHHRIQDHAVDRGVEFSQSGKNRGAQKETGSAEERSASIDLVHLEKSRAGQGRTRRARK